MAKETETETQDSLRDAIDAAMDETDNETDVESPGNEPEKAPAETEPVAEATEEPAEETTEVSAPEPETTAETETETESAADSALTAPEHWPDDHKALFAKQSPEAQQWMLDRHKSMESDYSRRIQEVAPLQKAVEPWQNYMQQIGITPDRAFATLAAAEYQLRTGTPEQKRAMLDKLATDYGIPLHPAEASVADQVDLRDPDVKAVQDELATVKANLSTMAQAAQTSQIESAQAQIHAFADEKTATGDLAHPYFSDVLDDVVRLARAETAAGGRPDLEQLYNSACWTNPTVREKLLSAQKAGEEKQRLADQKVKADKARKAAASVSGAPGDGTEPVSSPEDLRGTLEAAFDSAA